MAFVAMARDPDEGTAMFVQANEMARATGDHLTEFAHLQMINNSRLSFAAPHPRSWTMPCDHWPQPG